jgi:hypothetical protein
MILYHQTTIKPKYQAMLHVNATAQTCQIISITQMNKKARPPSEQDDDSSIQILRTGDRGLVRFRFMQRAEYLKIGTKLIFREGRTKGLGTVTEVFPAKEANVAGPSATTTAGAADSTNKALVRSSTKDGSKPVTSPGKHTIRHTRQHTADGVKH